MPRRSCAAVAGLVLASAAPARAQPVSTQQQSDDLFGVAKPKPDAAPACADGTGFACARATDPLAEQPSPFALTTLITAERWRDLAVADVDHEAITTFALGAARDGGGVFFAGATGLENRWLVEGSPTEALRTGGVETRVPLAFVESIRVTAGGFAAADSVGTGGVIDVRLIRGGDHHEVSAELWGSAAVSAEELPPAAFQFDPITTTLADPRAISLAVVARGPIARVAGARLWYAAGVRPVLRDDGADRDARRLVDADADGVPDLDDRNVPITAPIDHLALSERAYSVPILARVGAERGAHQLELTALITPYRDTRYAAAATESAAGIRRSGAIFDGIATWRGRWARTRARVTASWHRSQYDEDPRRGSADDRQILTAFIPVPADLADDPVLAAACDDTAADDAYPMIPNCPVPRGFFARGGVGLMFRETADRPALTAEVAHQLDHHVLTAGVAGEDARLVTRRRYSGGAQVRSLFADFTDTIGFVSVGDAADAVPCDDDPAETDRCRPLAEAKTTHRTRQLAVFVADAWRPRADWTFAGGVRWESMELGDELVFRDQIAPRIGFAWDPLGGGRSRVFAGFGRAYGVMPAGLGDIVRPRPPTVRELDFAGVPSREYDPGGAIAAVDPELAPMFTEQLTAGVELAVRGALRFTAWGQLAWLRRGIEDAPDAGGRLTLTNPTDPSATRRSAMAAVEVATLPGTRFGLRFQYQYARSVGASPGAFDPRLGAQLYSGPAYDDVVDRANLRGDLASDLRHRAVIEGVARARLGPVPVVIGVRAQLTTGRPLDTIGRGGATDVLLLGRGAGGRLGLVTTTNLHLAAGLGHGLELVADVFNLFDRQRVTAVDEVYTDTDAVPIRGGSSEDLVYLKDQDGNLVRPLASYGRPLSRQPPLSAAIGVRARF